MLFFKVAILNFFSTLIVQESLLFSTIFVANKNKSGSNNSFLSLLIAGIFEVARGGMKDGSKMPFGTKICQNVINYYV